MFDKVNPYQSPLAEPAAIPDGEAAGYTVASADFHSAEVWGWVACAGLGMNAVLAVAALCLLIGWPYLESYVAAVPLLSWQGLWSAMNGSRFATAIPFLAWEYRAYRNLPALGHHKLNAKFVWVIVCWFVPIMNLFCPYQVIDELYQRSNPFVDRNEQLLAAPGVIKGWWGTWLVTVAISLWERFFRGESDNVSAIWIDFGLQFAYLSASIVSAVLMILIIRTIDGEQRNRLAQIQETRRTAAGFRDPAT